MRKLTLLLLALALYNVGFSQEYRSYSWEESPVFQQAPDSFSNSNLVGLKQVTIVEYLAQGNALRQYYTSHKQYYVADEAAIEQVNKVYIPMYDVMQLVDIKARAINSSGEVRLVDKNNIKEVENVDEYGDFKIFAIEGVEPNSNIEVMYTVEKNYSPFGWVTLQEDYPVSQSKFIFVYGDNNARSKAYSTDSEFVSVSLNGKLSEVLELENIPAMLEEDFATPNSNKIAVAFQCFNAGNNITDRMIWSNVVRNVCGTAFPSSPSKKAYKDIKDNFADWSSSTDFEKVNWLDNFVKTSYTVSKNNNAELSEADYVLKNRTGSAMGILKAYGHYLTHLGVDYQVVLTANRYIHNFDPYFFAPRALQDFLIYIPSIKKYISPDRAEYRVGEAPFNILGNQGVFVNKELRFEAKKVTQVDPDFSRIRRDMSISFDSEMGKVILGQYQEYYGHWSATNRAVSQFSSEVGKEDFKDYLTASGIEDKITLEYELQNESLNQDEYNVPFIVESKISSESMIEDAGDSYIFLLGMVIGTQSELYQEEKRVNPILTRYPNTYNYTITVDIPVGFEVEGAEDLKIYKELTSEGKVVCKFDSNYELKDDKLIVTIEEFYRQLEIPMDQYEAFREVINAASDFNKSSILLTKNE